MKIGFTGTREGMTELQKKTFIHLFTGFREFDKKIKEFHDGNCEGSDIEARAIVTVHATKFKILHIHPSTLNERISPKWVNHLLCKVYPTKPPLERNHDIVDCDDVLIACPKEKLEVTRSGTWATIRYARKYNTPVYIIFPDGRITFYDAGNVGYDITPTRCPKCNSFEFMHVPGEYPIWECVECKERWFND